MLFDPAVINNHHEQRSASDRELESLRDKFDPALSFTKFSDRLHRHAMREKVFNPEDDEGDPDNTKTDQMRAVKRFLIKEYAQCKLDGRRNILKHTDHR